MCEGPKKSDLVLFDTLYFVGQFGALLAGAGSDRFGRWKSCYAMIIGSAVFNIILTVVLNVVTEYSSVRIVFAICRMCLGTMTGIFAVGTVLSIIFVFFKQLIF